MTRLLCKLFIKNYDHSDDVSVRQKYGTLAGAVGIITNVLLSMLKLIIGLLTASIAITADALNNLSDAGASIVSLVSFKLAAKPADKDHPFGHARIEYIASMIVSIMILIVGIEMLLDSLKSIFSPGTAIPPQFSVVSLIILGISILTKLWLSLFYRYIGKKIDSGVIRASGTDSLMDSISTATVMISSLIINFTGFYILDAYVGLGVSVLILIAGIRILNETKNSLLGEAPHTEVIEQINRIISEESEVIGVHDMLVHNYGPGKYIASFHAEVDGSKDIYMLHDKIDNLERRIGNEMNIMCTIHLDPIVTNDVVIDKLRNFVKEKISKLYPTIGIHDFRAVIGDTHTNIIFDIEVPFDVVTPPKEIISNICNAVKAERPECFCVITVDRY